MKKVLSIILTFVLLFSLNIQAFAISYSNEFTECYGINSLATARSPFHIGNTDSGADNYALPDHRVNGPNNQPRYLGGRSDLHNATDFRATAGTNVYPMFNGKVISIYQPVTVNNGYVIIQYDINNDGSFDNYYAKYTHINPDTSLYKNKTLSMTDKIGEIDITRGAGWPPHLDLKDTNSNGSISYKLYRYYRTVTNWGYGNYLEFITGDTMSYDNLAISVNSMDDGTNAAPTRVEFYYKIGSTGTWNQGPNMTKYINGNSSGAYYRYSLNLKNATGASSGDIIYYYLAAIRGNGTISTSYNWGLWPQYYKMPNKTPSQIIADGNSPITKYYIVP